MRTVGRRALAVATALLLVSSIEPVTSAVGLTGRLGGAARAATVVAWEHKGFSLPIWSESGLSDSGPALEQLKSIGANSVTFVVSWYTPGISSTELFRTGATASDVSLVFALQKARSLGMKANIKVHLEPQDNNWRAYINPANVDLWFANYGAILNHYADLGRIQSAHTLMIGAELISMSTNAAYDGRWRTLIAGVRQRFPGKLTYSANWGTDFGEEYPRITWWDALDYLGISAYFELASTTTPTVAQMRSSWASWISNKIVPFQQRWGKPVLFTENGYRSADGTARQPWNSWEQWPVDRGEQQDCYEAFFQTWSDVPWFAGTAFWAWNTNTTTSASDIWYEVQGKPAQTTIAAWFGGGTAPTPTPSPTPSPTPTSTPSPTPTPSPTATPTVQIRSPLSNQTYSGTITVQAAATNVQSVSYRVNDNAAQALSFDQPSGLWRASLNTTTLANGYYNVTVTGQGQNGAVVEDRAWFIRIQN